MPTTTWRNRYWRDRELPTSKAEFFDVLTTPVPAGDGTVATIRMYGPIDSWGGFWGVSAEDVSAVLDALGAEVMQIVLRINSPGGEVFEALTILNMLRAHRADVTAVVDGLAASAASVIAAGCDKTVMSPGTQMMIHNPSSIEYGTADDLRKTAEVLDGLAESLIEIYTAKAGDAADWPALLAAETWLTAQETVDLGLADEVAIVPDAGQALTAGNEQDDEVEVVLVPADARATRIAASGTDWLRAKAAHEFPIAAASGPTGNQTKETLMTEQTPQSQETAAPADETAAAADPATAPTPAAVDTVTVDRAAFEQLRADAAAGVQARAQQLHERRVAIVDQAIVDGKFAPAQREGYLSLLASAPEETETLIASMPANVVPVTELGYNAGDTVTKTAEQDAAFDKFAARMGLLNGASA